MMLLLLLLSRFSRVRLCATPETAAHQAPLCLSQQLKKKKKHILYYSIYIKNLESIN